jgi:hypothetical protein
MEYLASLSQRDGDQFGNARSVNLVFEQMKNRLAERKLKHLVRGLSDREALDELSTFQIADVPELEQRLFRNPVRSFIAPARRKPGVNEILRQPHMVMEAPAEYELRHNEEGEGTDETEGAGETATDSGSLPPRPEDPKISRANERKPATDR